MKNKIKVYQADFIFMFEKQAKEFENYILWKYFYKSKNIKYSFKYDGYICRCQFKTEEGWAKCLIECMDNRIYAIAINQKVKWVRE